MNDIINITDKAWNKIHNKLKSAGTDYKSVKIDITIKGCSGYSYKFDISKDEPSNLDKFIKEQDHFVIITPYAEPFVTGATLDYVVKDKFTQGFDFINNREVSRCGCGESFNMA